MKSHYCEQSGCLRRVFEPHLYCVKHQDANSSVTGAVSRICVVDRDRGRVLDVSGIKVELSYQDEGRTLKVFITEPEASK